jgi:hypothetical protein
MGTNYYVRTPGCDNACDHCAESRLIHLGKTSGGWRFSFQADPTWPRDRAFTEWQRLAGSGPIEDEYGLTVTLPELLDLIDQKRGGRSHLAPQPDLGVYRPSDGWFTNDGHEFGTRDFT